ncbi:hypothetical protein [Sphingomonas yunnanensis]|uniref:hypothetical protein n=1 Tax=Sphingomonas yunnanensis TaxID=310400 RepID=UPI003CCE60A0
MLEYVPVGTVARCAGQSIEVNVRSRAPRGRERRGEDGFVAMREQLDAGRSVPKLLLASIQVNIRARRFEEARANGVTYLRKPMKWSDR